MKKVLNKVGDTLKVETWTTIANKEKVKDLEEKIVSLSSNPYDGSQIKSPIGTKVNDISKLKKELNVQMCI